jgi:hypothetical protein
MQSSLCEYVRTLFEPPEDCDADYWSIIVSTKIIKYV